MPTQIQETPIPADEPPIPAEEGRGGLDVEGKVAVELKAVTCLERHHRAQCINYLRATGLKVCLLMNFGQRSLEVRRIVYRF